MLPASSGCASSSLAKNVVALWPGSYPRSLTLTSVMRSAGRGTFRLV